MGGDAGVARRLVSDDEGEDMSNPTRKLLAPVRPAMRLTAVLSGLGGLLSVVPYIALTEIARRLLVQETPSALWPWIALASACLLASELLHGAALGYSHTVEARLRYRLRQALIATLSRLPLGRVEQTSAGALRKLVCDDTSAIHTLVAHQAADATFAAVSAVAGLLYLAWVNWVLALILVVIWVAIPALALRVGYDQSLFADFSAAQTRLAAATVEMAEGIKEIKSFQASDAARTRFTAARTAFSSLSLRWTRAAGSGMAAAQALLQPATVLAVVAPLAVWFIRQDWLTPAESVAFFTLALGLPQGAIHLMSLMQHLYEAQRAAESTAAVLAQPPMPQGPGRDLPDPAPGHLELRDVTFGYEPSHPVVRNVSLQAAPGTVTAIVGPSGSGKTTLARLVARFYDPDQGSVHVGGVDVRETSFDWLYSRVAVVFQDITLAHDTVAHNLALGRPQASAEQLQAAARAVGMHERILQLPAGYDTVLGSAEGQLSGGERQRLTIARALLQDTDLLVLDEATAQADPQSERDIHAALSHLAVGRTVVVIAHRLSTVQNADQILVLEAGQVVERGTHSTLLSAEGLYAQLWSAQQGGE
ncbi:ABC transporter ATP-binding protein [Buchananella hordeovulneris]|uniref:ABC transporter ATP-binding protein n=1 Tax=Buchananella hordeovulneris TaxID=52770 RepID=UPI001C9E5B75|nr:ABC transporter ATP-binding protein [Buchananella hordeovulneris]